MAITLEQYAENQDRIAQEEIPRWIELVDDLDVARRAMFAAPIHYDPLNSASVMALSFATKQAEHLQSVRILVGAKQHRDALLIARTMLEGDVRLLWAFKRPEGRPDRWLRYGAILDWRQLGENENKGIIVEPSDKAMLKEYVNRYGDNYLDPEKIRKARQKAEDDQSAFAMPDDPWGKDWTRTDLRSMCVALGTDMVRVYDSAYRRSSEWVHSGPRGVLIATSAKADDPPAWGLNEFTEEDWPAAALALVLGCQSLLHALEVVDQRFPVGATDRLATIGERLDSAASQSVAATD